MTSRSARINALVATGGLALVLLVAPLSTLMTLAVIATMLGVALTCALTTNPVRMVPAQIETEVRRPR